MTQPNIRYISCTFMNKNWKLSWRIGHKEGEICLLIMSPFRKTKKGFEKKTILNILDDYTL